MTIQFPEDNPGAESRRTLDRLFSLTYEELRRLASTIRRDDPSVTLNTVALVNEAWLRLAKSPALEGKSKLEFKQIAARVMRELLIEAARRRRAQKRGGPDRWLFVSFDEMSGDGVANDSELLLLDAALKDLARLNPRQAQVVENRYFGGFELSETAALLRVSEATVERDWRAAKAWLSMQIRRSQESR